MDQAKQEVKPSVAFQRKTAAAVVVAVAAAAVDDERKKGVGIAEEVG